MCAAEFKVAYDAISGELLADLSQVRTRRRLGLMIGIELRQKEQDNLADLLERNIIALPAGPNVILVLPPLIIEKEQIDWVVKTLRELRA